MPFRVKAGSPENPLISSPPCAVASRGISLGPKFTGSTGRRLLPNDAPLISNGIEDVFFRDEWRGWAVGTTGLVLHTATGGR